MAVQTLSRPDTSNGIAAVGRPKKKEPTRTIRVYKRLGDAVTKIATSLDIDTPDLTEEYLLALIRDKGADAIERNAAIISPDVPKKGKR